MCIYIYIKKCQNLLIGIGQGLIGIFPSMIGIFPPLIGIFPSLIGIWHAPLKSWNWRDIAATRLAPVLKWHKFQILSEHLGFLSFRHRLYVVDFGSVQDVEVVPGNNMDKATIYIANTFKAFSHAETQTSSSRFSLGAQI